ncbi:MAG: 16S rRNA (cytosine(1402)-N(4))-methyltransferase RsmH [Betaproteobacteria bacterium]|nr:16S rRNA (cytosine(1402)-N(4))-methyltransferase RsmH [Betaproteobacteria bacterium]MDE2360971.1 16S rRNA (cytosine(1402)-N(4))-methyltransferase RsmH [Betaproteobacteria bacterium]
MPHAGHVASHVPVLLGETVAALAVRGDGIYVDATFGRGGHSRAILAALSPHGRLVAIDRDPQAETAAGAIADPRFVFRRARFSELPQVLAALAIARVDGVLLDLGVSSPQLEDPARGFSFRFDGPLDMRMDPTRGESAAGFVARASIDELTEVIRDYGEERFAQSVARAIAKAREVRPIVSTRQLADVVAQAIGARTRGDWRQDPAARTFQALRIAVNRELEELATTLPAAVPLLEHDGRLAVISFHSLEDRIVKRFIAWASRPFGGDPRLARVPIRERALPPAPLVAIGRAIKPSDTEIGANPRARSAVLRVAGRTQAPLPADWPRGFDAGLQ